MPNEVDVAIIGAGPAGSAAAAYLAARGYHIEVVERATFPRFSIGESLLPQAMAFLEEAGLLEDVVAEGFQFKDGAVFHRGGEEQSLEFSDKSASGWDTTFQVQRARFDDILAKRAATMGVHFCFGEEVTSFEPGANGAVVETRNADGQTRRIAARFVLDASGFGRVLARLASLDTPSDFPSRTSLFCHVRDNICDPSYDRNKILVCVHPENAQIWYWLIPFSDGTASIGVVGAVEDIARTDRDDEARLFELIQECPRMAGLLGNAQVVRSVRTNTGFARQVLRQTGPGFALLGNAAGFLDPVFSSGVTIALKSALLAARLLDRQFQGKDVDWVTEFETPLNVGTKAFRAYVEAWYDGSLQDIIFSQPKNKTDVKQKIISVLAGYAWDEDNAFVRDPKRYLSAVRQLTAPRT